MATAVLAVLALLTTAAYAKSGCSVATLKGNYAVTFSGFQVNDTPQPFYGDGLVTFDGEGNLAGSLNFSLNGVPSLNQPYTATYTVNPDCTGVANGTNGSDSFTFVVLDDGSEILGTDISAPDTMNEVFKKQDHRGDSNQPVLKNLDTLGDASTIAENSSGAGSGIADTRPDANTVWNNGYCEVDKSTNKLTGNCLATNRSLFACAMYKPQQCSPGAQAIHPGNWLWCSQHIAFVDLGRTCSTY
jgi:hypothetical protein